VPRACTDGASEGCASTDLRLRTLANKGPVLVFIAFPRISWRFGWCQRNGAGTARILRSDGLYVYQRDLD
jgi:hypothetical protein